MRIIFMGTPEFGRPTLEAVLAAGHQVVLVVSQPDRPAGRSRRPTPPPIGVFARERSLPLYQPERLRDEATSELLRAAAPDLIVVAAFGLILPEHVLELPSFGCLNVHPSLLPKYRGASPVQAALLAGDHETGVSIIRLTQRMDAGPILAQVALPIGPDDDALSLETRLATLGAGLLVDCLEPWAAGQLSARLQDEAEASYCPRLQRSDALLDWEQSAEVLVRVVRAFRGRSDAFTFWGSRLLKILSAEAAGVDGSGREPGSVFEHRSEANRREVLIAAGTGALRARTVALEGRSAMPIEAFLNGHPDFVGSTLGRAPVKQDPAVAGPFG